MSEKMTPAERENEDRIFRELEVIARRARRLGMTDEEFAAMLRQVAQRG